MGLHQFVEALPTPALINGQHLINLCLERYVLVKKVTSGRTIVFANLVILKLIRVTR